MEPLAELAIMRVLWENGRSTARELIDRLYPGERALAHPTVQKLLDRLEAKAYLHAGLEIIGLHWLLAAPAGLSITTADRAVWQKSVDVLRASVELCAELGGVYLVHGSPAQRRVRDPSDGRRAEEAWAHVEAHYRDMSLAEK